MRRLSLSTLLIGINVGLLLLAVVGVAVFAVSLLRQLADDQALARVEQAGSSARNAVDRLGQTAHTSAELLAERPTLLRLLTAGETQSLAVFLAQFQQTGQLDGAAVILSGRLVARSGEALAWDSILAAGREEPEYFISAPADGGPLILGASAPIPSLSGAMAIVAILLDDSISTQIGEEIGLPVVILPPQPAPGSLFALQERALNAGQISAGHLDDPERYVAVAPLRAPDGPGSRPPDPGSRDGIRDGLRDREQVAGLIEAELTAADVVRSQRQLFQRLLLLALGVATLAVLASLAAGRWLARPLQSLTAAAARIGYGDLSTPIPRASGAEMGTLSATLDEMRRRLLKLTADLRREQAESNAIVTGIVEGVFTVDRERRIQYVNPQAAALLGLPPDEIAGRFCGDVLDPQGPGGVRPCEDQCPILHSRFQGGARAVEHLRLSRSRRPGRDPGRDGARRTVVITSASPAGERQIQVMRDETEVEATRRLRDAVLANISHEFKTPLSAQLASIELLLDQLPDLTTAQIRELVVSLQRGALRLTQLIDNLLESVRIEAGRHTLRRRSVALDAVIEQAVEMVRPLLDQREQSAVVDLPYPLPTVSGDETRLAQVFVNLLANANKFAPPGTTVRIGGETGDGTVTIWVEDQGPGLPAAEGAALFAPFVRSSGEEPDERGVGLGLWIVKSIVERHGGRVEAVRGESGTRMCVSLPRERPDENSGR